MSLKFPTNKEYISFSEIKDYVDCSWRHKLKHIKKINLFQENVYTNFGSSVHASCEDYVKTRKMKYEIALDMIAESWQKYEFPEMGLWMQKANNVLEAVPDFMDARFPGWECFNAEEELNELIPNVDVVKFKGYIDAIIKHKDSYFLLDWKSSTKGWNDYKKKDELVHLQLILYHLFWSQKHKINPKNIKVGFVILNHDFNAPQRIDFFTLKITESMEKKSLNIIDNMVKHVSNKKAFKKWKYSDPRFQGACRFCDFNGTEWCP